MDAMTTREAAEVLGVASKDALGLLKAANVPNRAIESGGYVHQYLWDANAVRRLQAILLQNRQGGEENGTPTSGC